MGPPGERGYSPADAGRPQESRKPHVVLSRVPLPGSALCRPPEPPYLGNPAPARRASPRGPVNDPFGGSSSLAEVPKTLGRVRNRLRGARGMNERGRPEAWALVGVGA